MQANADSPRCAFAFPGVGARLSGHEASFFVEHQRAMRPLLEQASEHAGADLEAALREAQPVGWGELSWQLFTYAFGCAVAAVYRAHGIEPVLTAGHSLGLYGALHAAGAIDFAAGLAITETAYRTAQRHCPAGRYDLGVVMGFNRQELDDLLRQAGPRSVRLVNVNNPTSLILAGEVADLDACLTLSTARGALKAQRLGAGLPYHHPELLRGVSEELAAFLRTLAWHEPRCPVVSSLDHSLVTTSAGLVALTAGNIAHPIDWQQVVATLAREGVELALECGAGHTLSQNARLCDPSPRFLDLKLACRRLGI
jgi:malonyl CoA-acyl carrier protein transacylase